MTMPFILQQQPHFNQLLDEHFNRTTVHPIGLVAVFLLGLTVLCIRRERAILPMFVMAAFISTAQRVVIGGLDFDFIRIMVVFGWFRVVWRGEFRDFTWKPIDFLIVIYVLHAIAANVLLKETVAAFIGSLGVSFDIAGVYFLVRILIRDWNDVRSIAFSAVIVSIPTAVAFMLEWSTGKNAFAVFGGLPEQTRVRDGGYRCQGAFIHPIMAGCFWVVLVPLVASQWWQPRANRFLVGVGLICSLIIIYLCRSSTPVMALLGGACLACCFPYRRYLSVVRWAAVISLLIMHLSMYVSMGEPIWYVFKVISYAGGTGEHRYNLYEKTIEHFDEWVMLGVKDTRHWKYGGVGGGKEKGDATSEYVGEAIDGGIIRLVLFLMILGVAFQGVGRMLRQSEDDLAQSTTAWALGICLAIACTAFLAVQFFGQIKLVWYLLLGVIGSMSPLALVPGPALERSRARSGSGVATPAG